MSALADYYGPMTIERNWAGNLTYRASAVEHPGSIDELRHLLARGGAARILGSVSYTHLTLPTIYSV